MKEISLSYTDLRKIAGEDLPFNQITEFDLQEYRSENDARINWLVEEIERLRKSIKIKDKLTDQSETLFNAISNLSNQLETIDAGIHSLGVSEDDESVLQREEDQIRVQIEQLAREIEEKRIEVARIDGLKEEAARLEESRRNIIREIDEDLIKFYELREATHDIDYSEDRFADMHRQLGELEELIDDARRACAEIDAEIGVIQRDLNHIPEVQSEIDKLESIISEKETLILKIRELENLFLQTGYNIRKRLVPQIEAYFAWVLPKMTRNRYHKVSLGDDFEIKVFSNDRGDFVNLDVLSGGTVDQLMISLRLAFARATFASSTTANNFLFLDEPFSSFDESRRELFFNLLQTLKSNFQQIFLISHLPNLEDFVDYYFRLDLKSEEMPAAASWTGITAEV